MSPEDALRVVVVGGGVAGLETILALRELAGERVAVTLLSPDADFVYTPLTVREPFAGRHATRYPLAEFASEVGAELRTGALAAVDADGREVVTGDGDRIPYDALALTVGAIREPAFEHVLTYRTGEDAEAMHGLVQDVEEGYAKRIAFVVPAGITWPLPLYELALMTADRARSMSLDVELMFVTPETGPLDIFGDEASESVRGLLGDAGIKLETGAKPSVSGDLTVGLGATRRVQVDRVIALPRLRGPVIDGVPHDDSGFIPVGEHGQVTGLDAVYAAGDGIQFPLKQGGIATQQADVVAQAIAHDAGAPVEVAEFNPVLRGLLLTGGREQFLRGDESRSESAAYALWWPPAKIAGRYLAPFLAERAGDEKPLVSEPREGHEVEAALGSSAPVVKRRIVITPDASGHAQIGELD